jgi:hypothetical protein
MGRLEITGLYDYLISISELVTPDNFYKHYISNDNMVYFNDNDIDYLGEVADEYSITEIDNLFQKDFNWGTGGAHTKGLINNFFDLAGFTGFEVREDLLDKHYFIFLKLYTNSTKTPQIYNAVDWKITLITYISANKSDSALNLMGIQQFNFKKFDEEVGIKVKEYLETPSLRVDNLEMAYYFQGRRYGNIPAGFRWESDPSEVLSGLCKPETIVKVTDESLWRRYATFDEPIDSLPGKRFDYQVEGPFTTLGINGTDIDANAWIPYFSDDVSIREYYGKFFLTLINSIEVVRNRSNENTKFNVVRVEKAKNRIQKEFLDQEINFTTGPSVSLGQYYRDAISRTDVTASLRQYIAKLILDNFRRNFWNKLTKNLNLSCDDLDKLGNNLGMKARVFEEAEEEAPDLEDLSSGGVAEEETLSDEDIEAKQKFLKQCMLMTRLDDLANENLKDTCKQVIEGGGKIHKKNKPYSNRFYMVQDDPNGDQSAMVNKLIIPPGDAIREFLDMRPSTHAYLVPKLRFYKVYTNKEGELSEFRFHFANFTDPNRVEKLSNSAFDRGGDYGVKSFDFSFEGATPATAKNDIKANLSLYFQSFGDFVDRKFSSDDGEKHAFVDLLLLPSGKQKDGSGSPSIFQFAAKYYRIRVDVGWEIASSRIDDLNEAIGTKAAAKLTESLKKMNKSFLLNMIDHTMEFKDDGSIQIDVEYRAYIESALKGTTMDALASKEAREALKVIRKDYEKVVSANKCSAEELNEIRVQLEQIEDLFVKQSYQSIMKRLIQNGSIKFKKARDGSSKQFLSRGILTTKVEFINTDSATGDKTTLLEASKTGTFLNSGAGFVDLKSKDDYLYINYFYLGDLLYAITDCMYDDSGRLMEGLEKFKFVLGSFDYEDLLENNNPKKTINLANIPISCELFYEWFTENVIKPERNNYPIMYFIRDLCKFLIVEILSETCFKRSLDKSLQFKTMNFLGKQIKNTDPLASLYVYNKDKPENLVLNLSEHYGSRLPLSVDDENIVSVRDVYNYMTIYVETPRLKSKKDRKTTKRDDEAEGIMHYQIGRDRGILKKIKFAKSDMQYIREARFFRHGNDGLMQLSAVYKVTMEMVGNTLYYPGMEIFIDPLGLLGADLQADPRERNSIANRLGFGGYHLITNVRSSIGPGKFTTTVDALFSYSGDGDPSSRVVGTTDQIKSKEKNISEKADNRSAASKKFCADVYDHVITEAILIDYGSDKYNPIDINSTDPATEEAVEARREERPEEAIDKTAREIPADPSRPFSEEVEEDEGVTNDDGTIITYPSDIY